MIKLKVRVDKPVSCMDKTMASKNCSRCSFFMNFTNSPISAVFKDQVFTRCMKEERKEPGGWPPKIVDPENESCDHYIVFDPLRSRWEWDDTKDAKNIEKHGFSFKEAVEAFESDPYRVRSPVGDPEKWEKLESLDYEAKGIPKTDANTDPLRDHYLFRKDGKLYSMITTLRGEGGMIRQRVISFRRTSHKKDLEYYEWAMEQTKNGARFI